MEKKYVRRHGCKHNPSEHIKPIINFPHDKNLRLSTIAENWWICYEVSKPALIHLTLPQRILTIADSFFSRRKRKAIPYMPESLMINWSFQTCLFAHCCFLSVRYDKYVCLSPRLCTGASLHPFESYKKMNGTLCDSYVKLGLRFGIYPSFA